MRWAPSQQGGGQRRYLTVLFSDLSDSTLLGASMEAEHYAELLGRLRQAYDEVVTRHGGIIVRVQGDGALAIFGYPHAREDDGRCAVTAALELHALVHELSVAPAVLPAPTLSLHTGIHAGLMLVNEGDVMRGRFELLGDAPNVAAKLSHAARPEEILVSSETLGPQRRFFEVAEQRRIAVKGRARPLPVYRIVGHATVDTQLEGAARRGLAPFVGREHELAALERAMTQARSGQPGHVALCARAGLGKTRLADEFLRRVAAAGNVQIHQGYCESDLGARPLQPFLQMLAAIDAQRPPADLSVAGLVELFDTLAATRPQLLFVDDWQWADDATHQVLDAIRGLERPILVLTATRELTASVGVVRNDALVLALEPLTGDESSRTVAQLLPGTDPFVAGEICRHAGGNPLFIEELCHSAVHDEATIRLGRAPGNAAWLNVLVESRVARLPETQAELVRAAAIIGNVIPGWLLENITGCPSDHPLVLDLAEQDFIFPGEQPGTLRFKHGITRNAIYESVGLHQRRALHGRVVQALLAEHPDGAPEEPCEALAYHCGAAGRSDDAARYAERAGDKAMAAGALDRAKTQYSAALAALAQLPVTRELCLRWVALAQRLGYTTVFHASHGEIDVFKRTVELAEASTDDAAIAQARYWLGYIHYALGYAREAQHHCELALQAAERVGDDPLRVQIRATLGQIAAAAANYPRAMKLLDDAIGVKRKHRSGSRPAVGIAYSLACKAQLLGDQGRFDEAHACFDEAQEAVRGAQHEVQASILGCRSAVLLWQGRWEDARRCAADACRIGEQLRSLFTYSMGRSAGAYANWMLEHQPQCLKVIEEAAAWLEAREGALFSSFNHGWLTDGLVSLGDRSKARHHAARALRRARQGDLIGVAMTWRALASQAASCNDERRSQHCIGQALATARLRNSPHEAASTQLCAAGIELAFGHRRRAAGLLDEAGFAFEAMRMDWHAQQARQLRERL